MSKKDKNENKATENPETADSTDNSGLPGQEALEADESPRVLELTEALKACEDQALRVRAEYDNYRKRSQKERETTYTLALSEVVGSFIPVVDNMERACAAECADEGVKMILKQLLGVLERFGVEAVGVPGEAFDPNVHNAVSHEGEGGESVISEVLQKGYRLGERLIRPAMVKTRS